MFYKEKIFIVTTSLILLFACRSVALVETNNQQDTVLNSAIRLFNSGGFETASTKFKKLVAGNPGDEMLNYYYGACLVEQNIFTDETIQHLLKAVSGNTPDKIFYYVGKYYQSKELWNSALKYYNRFKNFGSDSDKEAVQIEKLIEFCYSNANLKNGQVSDRLTVNPDSVKSEKIDIQIPDTIPAENPGTLEKEVPQIEAPGTDETFKAPENPLKEEKFEPIHFQVNSEIEYLKPEHFKNAQALEFFNQGITTEKKLQRVLAESDSLRDVYSLATINRADISEKIISLEQESMTLKNQTAFSFNKARELEQAYWESATEVEINKFKEENNKFMLQFQKEEEPKISTEVPTVVEPLIILPEEPLKAKTEAPKKVDEIMYKIQIGFCKGKLPDNVDKLYKKLSQIRVIDHYKDDRGVTFYTTGNLTNFDDAVRMQSQVRQEGIKDAFVVAYKNRKRISINEAKVLTTKK